MPGLFRVRRSSSDPEGTAACTVYVAGPLLLLPTIAVAVVTCSIKIPDWVGRIGGAVTVTSDRTCSGVGVKVGLSVDAAMGDAVAVASCVTTADLPSRSSAAVSTWVSVGVGSKIVLVSRIRSRLTLAYAAIDLIISLESHSYRYLRLDETDKAIKFAAVGLSRLALVRSYSSRE